MSEQVWVKTEPSVDGKTYVVSLVASEDHAVVLDRDAAFEYAAYVLDAAERAAYDAAVMKQVRSKMGLDLETAGQVVKDLRGDRPEPDHRWPIVLIPGVSVFTGEAFLAIHPGVGPAAREVFARPTDVLGQWSPDDARGHVSHVLSAVAVADLDAGYYRVLRSAVGVDDGVARQVIDDLRSHR